MFRSEAAIPRYWLFCSTLFSKLRAVGAAPAERDRGRGTGTGAAPGKGRGKVGGRKGLMKMLIGAAGVAVVVVELLAPLVVVVEEEEVTNFTGSRI